MNPPWDRGALLSSPRFASLHRVIASLPEHGWPDLEALCALADQRAVANAGGQRVRFVEAGPVDDYEARVTATGEVPTRAGSWHDLFNALAWLAFPRAKAALNRLHGEHRVAGARGTARDVLTLFDEDGLVMATSEPSLATLLAGFRWRELFVARREDVRRHVRFLGFGHALHEKLIAPFRGLTAKVVVVNVPPARLSSPHLVDEVDSALATRLAEPAMLASTRSLAPLPVQGIPGWWEANEDPAFYDDVGQFRAGRRNETVPNDENAPIPGGVPNDENAPIPGGV